MICHPKGSEWRKWDLHAHTPLDHEWINSPQLNTDEEKKTFAEKYISFAKQQEIEVIGLTDHNFCNELKDSLYPYIIEEANKNGITILPGFEITVQDGSGIHLLVLFEEKTELSSIYDLVKRLFPLYLNLIPSTGRVPVSNKSIDQLIIELKDLKLNHLLIFAHGDRENGVLDKGTITGTRRVE
ncbi:MAG: PHP domain-containing protein [Segetibacter sp.]